MNDDETKRHEEFVAQGVADAKIREERREIIETASYAASLVRAESLVRAFERYREQRGDPPCVCDSSDHIFGCAWWAIDELQRLKK